MLSYKGIAVITVVLMVVHAIISKETQPIPDVAWKTCSLKDASISGKAIKIELDCDGETITTNNNAAVLAAITNKPIKCASQDLYIIGFRTTTDIDCWAG